MSIECGSPFLLDGDREFAAITVQGQSFMLHQIRKMIGLVIAIVKGYATEAIFEDVFKPERVGSPGALGSVLQFYCFDYRWISQWRQDWDCYLIRSITPTTINGFALMEAISPLTGRGIR